jgi:hypothetical protein
LLPKHFNKLNSRDKFLQQRKLYSQLLEHYEKIKESGQLLDNRPDLQTMKHMNEQGTSFDYQNLRDVPSVEVEDTFDFYCEMFVIELHPQVQGGIVIIPITAQDHDPACLHATLSHWSSIHAISP